MDYSTEVFGHAVCKTAKFGPFLHQGRICNPQNGSIPQVYKFFAHSYMLGGIVARR